jgi:hypothetical protein
MAEWGCGMAFLDAIGRSIRNATTLSFRAIIANPRRSSSLTPADRAFEDFVARILFHVQT